MARIRAAVLIACAGLLYGCPILYRVPVQNNAGLTLDVFVNCSYPDTTFLRSLYNSYVDPSRRGGVVLVNRRWHEYLQRKDAITVFFAEQRNPKEIDRRRPTGRQKVYGKITLTLAKLDSLGWEIAFPDDVVPVEADLTTWLEERRATPPRPYWESPNEC